MKLKLLFSVACLSVLLAACGGGQNKMITGKAPKGEAYYGGYLRMNEVEGAQNLYPLSINDLGSYHVGSQIYQGLVRFSQKDLTIEPCIAEKWTKNADATIWTFTLREDVLFADDACFENEKGRKVTANDIKYCFDKLCNASKQNIQFSSTFRGLVKGADEAYAQSQKQPNTVHSVSGVKVLDEHTIQIQLYNPFSEFLNILATAACWIYPQEAVEKYGDGLKNKCVGTGPFKLTFLDIQKGATLERNPNYWESDSYGNPLPYLEGIEVSFITNKKKELEEFRKGKIDMVFQLPSDMIKEILYDFKNAQDNIAFNLQVTPSMSVFYYGFQNQSNTFKDLRVRQAFNYAINREEIVNFVLMGGALPAYNGIVPPSFKYFNHQQLKGYSYDVDKAQKLMADAGFANGKGFPKFTLYSNRGSSERNHQVALRVQNMLKQNLGVEMEIKELSFQEQKVLVKKGEVEMFRTTWMADFADPLSFLNILYSKNIPNMQNTSGINDCHYNNPAYDKLIDLAYRETNIQKRFQLYQQASQILLDEAPLIPVFYEENYRLVRKEVSNFEANPLEYRDLTQVYITPTKQL